MLIVQHAVREEAEVFEVPPRLNQLCRKRGSVPCQSAMQRADDDGDAERRDHDDVDVAALASGA